ncbi:A24 family peptidase [Rhodosalinus sediminis]|jgi:prepilin peptidase CpaA|uniref:A24 family peptidase n=1 Tax=Rhodosalinus sediminis TaxID=1940533 RepID=UPI0023533BA2|nr:prepilin peptidase [Rhodosalinus sediminis]
MEIAASAALWFLPFAAPICLYVAWSDLATMKIPNKANLALAGVFLVVGLWALPLAEYPWRLAQLAGVLVVGILLNAGGLLGAGDAKFLAAAAPFVAPGDALAVTVLFAGVLLAAYVAHRLARATPLRALAPDWESWQRTKDFPMGFALGPTLLAYLALGAVHGA